MTTCSPRKENLIKPGPAEHRPATFGHKGQVYDGWETRRRRGVTGDTHDAAIVRLAGPAVDSFGSRKSARSGGHS
jgi:allantoicase